MYLTCTARGLLAALEEPGSVRRWEWLLKGCQGREVSGWRVGGEPWLGSGVQNSHPSSSLICGGHSNKFPPALGFCSPDKERSERRLSKAPSAQWTGDGLIFAPNKLHGLQQAFDLSLPNYEMGTVLLT